jgi:hypothetical protein
MIHVRFLTLDLKNNNLPNYILFKMKTLIFIAVLILTTNVSFSQDYMDNIALKACECLNTVSDTLEPERVNMELGLCMINAASPYKKQLKEDYNIDFNKIGNQGAELGRIIGLRMAAVCPDNMIKMVNKVNKNGSNNMSESTIEGKITGILDDKFVEFSIKDNKGKTSRYYWLTFIESNTELSTDYKKLIDKNVQITFISQEYFDARISEYRTFHIIKKLEVIEN